MTGERHMDNSEPTPGKSPGQDQAETATPSVGDTGEASKNLPPTYTTGPGEEGGVRPGETLSPEKDDTGLEATTAAVQSEAPPDAGPPVTEAEAADPKVEAVKLMDEFINTLPENVKSQYVENIQKSAEVIMNQGSSPEALIQALKKSPFPPGTPPEAIQQMLIDSGHPEDKVNVVMARKTEWETTEEDIAGEPELTEEEQAALPQTKEEGEQMVNAMKEAIAKANAATTPEEVEEVKNFQEGVRSRLGRWLDKNPGKLHKVNRLLVRPGVAALLMLAIIYLSLLSVATKSATAKVGGK